MTCRQAHLPAAPRRTPVSTKGLVGRAVHSESAVVERASAGSRFEYRVFAPSLGVLRDRLAGRMRKREGDSGSDLYLLGRRFDRNVKVRENTLDLKALRETSRQLERWEPVDKLPFPLAGAWIRGPLAEYLGVESLEATRERYSLEALVDEVVRPAAALRFATVDKERQRFEKDCVRAEFVQLRAAGQSSESVAVEGSDAVEVRTWVERLGLGKWPNTSYVRWLRDSVEGSTDGSRNRA